MIKLFGHYFKKRLHILIIISVILVLVHLVIYGGNYIIESTRDDGYGAYEVLKPNNNPINFYSYISIILATIIPIFEFRFKMKKVSVDHFYSLPIKREKLFATKYLIGLAEVLVPLTVLFIYTLISMTLGKHIFDLKYYFIYYLVSFVLITALYSINTFAFSKCNKIIDGIINMAFYSLLLMVAYYLFWYFIVMPAMVFDLANKIEPFINGSITLLIPQESLIYAGNILKNLMEGNTYSNLSLNEDISMYVIIVIAAIVSVVLLILLSKKEKAENTLDISDSYFAFKLIIPLFVFASSLLIPSLGLLYALLLVIFGYILFVIYRRTFKIKKIDIIVLAITITSGLTLGVIGVLIDMWKNRVY